MEQNQQFTCTGDCLKCTIAQRQYCSCQHAYNTMRLIQSMQDSINTMSGTVEELKAKISTIQDNEAMVFDPTEKPETPTSLNGPSENPTGHDITQGGVGV